MAKMIVQKILIGQFLIEELAAKCLMSSMGINQFTKIERLKDKIETLMMWNMKSKRNSARSSPMQSWLNRINF